jgi:ribonuclease P protein component
MPAARFIHRIFSLCRGAPKHGFEAAIVDHLGAFMLQSQVALNHQTGCLAAARDRQILGLSAPRLIERLSTRALVPNKCQPDHAHEAHLPSVEDPPRPYPRLSLADENPRRPCRAERAPGQGAQASGSLNWRPAAAAQTMTAAAACRPIRPWVSLGGAALKAMLATPTVARTAHFALHAPSVEPIAPELPTEAAPGRTESVDKYGSAAAPPLRLALVVPKRHAKRAATRNLVKRQMREAVRCRGDDWPIGPLLIRQRRAFNLQQFPSAASDALRRAVRAELDQLFEWAAGAQ